VANYCRTKTQKLEQIKIMLSQSTECREKEAVTKRHSIEQRCMFKNAEAVQETI